jgi:serine/threonine protein kinase
MTDYPDEKNPMDLPAKLVEDHRSVLFHPGKIIAGRFEIVEQLGFGWLGAVYKVKYLLPVGPVGAIKVILPSLVMSPEARERFFREATSARSLRHEGCVAIYEIYEDRDEDILFFSMELLEGRNLEDYLNARGEKMSFRETSDIILQICDVLSYAHGKGVIHTGITPRNICITADGNVKLLDFGLTRLLSSVERPRVSMDSGVDSYMAPEQLGGEGADSRSDIFALGVVFYHMLTVQDPGGKSRWTPGIEGIIQKCLKPQPKDRFQDISSFVQVFEQIRNDTLDLKEDSGIIREHAVTREVHEEDNKKQETQKWIGALAIIILIAVISVLFSYFAIKRQDRSQSVLDRTRLTEQAGTAPESQREPEPLLPEPMAFSTYRQTLIIDSLLEQAGEHIKAQRYTSPSGNNAFAILRDVLAKDPDNKRAQEIIRKIRDMYMTKGEEALRNRDYLIAVTYYQKALYVYPEYSQARKKLRESLAFLNIVTKKSARDAEVSSAAISEKDIKYLMTEAEEQYKSHRYTSPPGNNAFDSLRGVLAKDPDNKRAQEIIRKIRDFYMTKGERAFGNRDYLIAVTYYQKALYVHPGYLPAEGKIKEINRFLDESD